MVLLLGQMARGLTSSRSFSLSLKALITHTLTRAPSHKSSGPHWNWILIQVSFNSILNLVFEVSFTVTNSNYIKKRQHWKNEMDKKFINPEEWTLNSWAGFSSLNAHYATSFQLHKWTFNHYMNDVTLTLQILTVSKTSQRHLLTVNHSMIMTNKTLSCTLVQFMMTSQSITVLEGFVLAAVARTVVAIRPWCVWSF